MKTGIVAEEMREAPNGIVKLETIQKEEKQVITDKRVEKRGKRESRRDNGEIFTLRGRSKTKIEWNWTGSRTHRRDGARGAQAGWRASELSYLNPRHSTRLDMRGWGYETTSKQRIYHCSATNNSLRRSSKSKAFSIRSFDIRPAALGRPAIRRGFSRGNSFKSFRRNRHDNLADITHRTRQKKPRWSGRTR